MVLTYGAIGTNPFRKLDATPEHLLATYLKDNYDSSFTGVDTNDIKWEQWPEGIGDCFIFFDGSITSGSDQDTGWNLQDNVKYVDIHIIVKKLGPLGFDYETSADKILFDFETWIKYLIHSNHRGLEDKGIYLIEYINTRPVSLGDADNDMKRIVVSVRMKYWMTIRDV